MNIVDFYVADNFRITSDPRKYSSGIFGLRDYTVNGHNYDSFCGGYHLAVDLSKEDGAPIKSFADGEVVDGTGNGGFGKQVVVAYKHLGIQVIFGHVKANIPVKIGQKVKKGQVIAYQGNTHNQGKNVTMASHLHLQVQEYGYIESFQEFTCSGINPFNIKIDNNKPSGNPKVVASQSGTYVVELGDTLWSISQEHNTAVNKLKSWNNLKDNIISVGQELIVSEDVYMVRKGDTLWSISQKFNTSVDSIKKENNLSGDTINIGQTLNITANSKPKPKPKPKFNKMANRKLSKSAHFKGTVDKAGAEVRNRSGNNFNRKAGYSIKPNEEVFIFQVVNGWGKIYTSRTSGNGSNDWIWLERLNVTEVF